MISHRMAAAALFFPLLLTSVGVAGVENPQRVVLSQIVFFVH